MRFRPRNTSQTNICHALAVAICLSARCSWADAADGPTSRPTVLSGLNEAVAAATGNGDPQPPQTQPSTQPATSPPSRATDAQPAKGDLRELIGVNPAGLKRVELPRIPTMTVRGYINANGRGPTALLEITELNRVFLVHEGTEIPIMVQGRITPLGRSELTGLVDQARPANSAGENAGEQSQIILTVLKVSNEGVTVKAGLNSQTLIIR